MILQGPVVQGPAQWEQGLCTHCPTPGGVIHTDCSMNGLDPWICTLPGPGIPPSGHWHRNGMGEGTPPHPHPYRAHPCPSGHQPQTTVKFSSPALSVHCAAVLGAVQPGDWQQSNRSQGGEARAPSRQHCLFIIMQVHW